MWVWIVFLILAVGVTVFAVRMSRRAREDPFGDVPRDEGTTMLAPREGAAPVATPEDEPVRRTSLEERLRAAAAARTARTTSSEDAPSRPEPAEPPRVRRDAPGPDIVPLDPSRRSEHEQRWRQISEAISRSPASALAEADAFVREVMTERGFPVDAEDDSITEAAVAHPDVMDPYRLATAIAAKATAGRASEEELRRAGVHVRDVVRQLFADDPARTT